MVGAARLMVVLGLVLSSRSAAGEPGPRRAPVELTFRTQLPFTTLLVGDGTGYWTLGGGAVSVHLLRLVEVEVGAEIIKNPCVMGSVLTARAGLAPTLGGPRADGSGFRVRLPVLAAYQRVRASGDGCDGQDSDSFDAWSVGAGLEGTFFPGPAGGASVRLLGFVGPPVQAATGAVGGVAFHVGWTFAIL